MDIIAEEIDYYKTNRQEFITQYGGKHLVIKGKAIIGIYNSNTEAMADTIISHEAGTFIIEHPVALKVR